MNTTGEHYLKRAPTIRELQKKCDDWNSAVGVGMMVRYHPVIGRPAFRERKTRDRAFILSGHTACVFLEGESGCVALDACEIIR